ncbi:MAG: PAS domain S-box protein [Pseudomonadales bacterium]|nr:PAS domain S-box protein [Pseudomonadales bacterium]
MSRLSDSKTGSLARQLALAVVLISIVVTLLTSGAYLYLRWQKEIANITLQLEEVEGSYLAGIGARVWVADIESLQLDLAGLLKLKSIEYVAVMAQGQLLIEAGKHPSANLITRRLPIVYPFHAEPREIGELVIEASSSDVYESLFANAFLVILLIALQTSFVAGVVLLLVNRGITRHLRSIAIFARQLELSNIENPLVLDRRDNPSRLPDELDMLVEALATMQFQLHKSVLSLSASEENLALTLDSIGDGVIATDRNGKVTRMNPVAERLTGWPSVAAIGQSILDVFPVFDAATHEKTPCPVHEAIATGETVTLSNNRTLVTRDNKEYQVADSAAPIRNGELVIGAILVFRDETSQYLMRRILRDNQKRLRLYVEQTPLGVVELDLDANITAWNPAAERIFGYTRQEAVGNSATELIVPADRRSDISVRIQEILANRSFINRPIKNITKNGDLIICEWLNTALVDVDEQVVGITSLVVDITVQVQAEEKNRRQQQEQEQMLENMMDAVVSFDEAGVVLNVNSSAAQMFGYSVNEIVGESFSQLMPESTGQRYLDFLEDYLIHGKSQVLGRAHEVSVVNKNGQLMPIRLSVATLPETEDGRRRFVATFHDLSSEKKTEEQLRRSQKMDALGKLTGGIAHDYNNMLSMVLGFTELLEEDLRSDATLGGYVEHIRHAGQRGVKLTQKLLAFSKSKPVEAAAVNVNVILRDQRHMVEKVLTARIEIKMDLGVDLWQVFIDAGDFEDAVMNLCLNAMYATSGNGSLAVKTSNQILSMTEAQLVDLAVGGEYVRLEVTDTGVGMDDETLGHIFEPFFTTKGEQGTGMGLSQVYGFVKRSDGAIHVRSKLNHGSTFILYFPRYGANAEPAQKPVQVARSSFTGNETILVVDDEPGLLSLAMDVLGRQGYKVLCASNGADALGVLALNKVDLLLSDVIMPGMDGHQLAAKVSADYPDIKIQLISGFDAAKSGEQQSARSSYSVLAKPYSMQELLARVRRLLDG